jgi:membrane associated rhomboid family serine protease
MEVCDGYFPPDPFQPPRIMNDPGLKFADFSANLKNIPEARVSCGVAFCILAIHAALELSGGVEVHRNWFAALGLSRDGLLDGGVWRLVTHAFLHGTWGHVMVNALLVLGIGSRIERMVGPAVAAGAMLAGVLLGGLFHVVLDAGLLVGFSGAGVALLLLLVTLSPGSRMMPLPLSGKSLGLGIMLAALMLALVNPPLGVPGFSAVGRWLAGHGLGEWFQIGHACHFGGGVAGWLVGRWVLRPRVSLAKLQRDRAAREARVTGGHAD